MIPDSVLILRTAQEWRAWLQQRHANSSGVWLLLASRDSGGSHLSHPQALDEALCFGWIDAQRRAGPAAFWLQRFTPRGPRSIWSKINRAKALSLIDAGRMQPAGMEAIEKAKRNGQWDSAYDGARTAAIPDDLRAALDGNQAAATMFEKLSAQNRYAILFRLHKVKRAETRERKLREYIAMLERGETIHPQKR